MTPLVSNSMKADVSNWYLSVSSVNTTQKVSPPTLGSTNPTTLMALVAQGPLGQCVDRKLTQSLSHQARGCNARELTPLVSAAAFDKDNIDHLPDSVAIMLAILFAWVFKGGYEVVWSDLRPHIEQTESDEVIKDFVEDVYEQHDFLSGVLNPDDRTYDLGKLPYSIELMRMCYERWCHCVDINYRYVSEINEDEYDEDEYDEEHEDCSCEAWLFDFSGWMTREEEACEAWLDDFSGWMTREEEACEQDEDECEQDEDEDEAWLLENVMF